MAGGAGVKAGVDAAEKHAQAGRDHIGNRLAVGGSELRRTRSAG
jgi:hypothetical protein